MTWQAIALEFKFGERQTVAHAERLMAPEEKNLCLSLEVKMEETRGTLNLAVPAVVSNALLRKISADLSYQRPRGPIEARRTLEKRLLEASFDVELSTPHLPLFLQDLAGLTPETVLTFPRSPFAPAAMLVDGVHLCTAMPVRVNERRGARVIAWESQLAQAGKS